MQKKLPIALPTAVHNSRWKLPRAGLGSVAGSCGLASDGKEICQGRAIPGELLEKGVLKEL
jgi:hypothetical protein